MRQNLQNNVREIRTKLGLTQEQLAEHVRVSRQTIIAIEKGNYVPSVFLALSIARCFKKSLEELFYLES